MKLQVKKSVPYFLQQPSSVDNFQVENLKIVTCPAKFIKPLIQSLADCFQLGDTRIRDALPNTCQFNDAKNSTINRYSFALFKSLLYNKITTFSLEKHQYVQNTLRSFRCLFLIRDLIRNTMDIYLFKYFIFRRNDPND